MSFGFIFWGVYGYEEMNVRDNDRGNKLSLVIYIHYQIRRFTSVKK